MIRSAARQALGAAASRWPSPTYALVGALARATAPFASGEPHTRRLRQLLPQLTATDSRRARLRQRSTEWKSRALGVVMKTATGETVFPAVRLSAPLPDPSAPAVFVTYHIGALAAIAAVLQTLPRKVATLHRMEWPLPSNLVAVYVDRTPAARAAAFHRAVENVRAGGHAFMSNDARGIEVPVLGRSYSLTRGPFAVSRLTGAPVVPLIAQWSRGRVHIFVGDTIPAGEDEREMALAAARGLDRYLRAHPGEVTVQLAEELIEGPRPRPAP